MPDVIVIGGGVVGSYLAGRLAGIGYAVTVIEKKPEIGGPVCCTGIISRECVAGFRIDEDIVLRRYKSAMLISPDKKVISLQRPEVQACVVDRGALDSMMAERAQAAGAAFIYNSPVIHIDIADDGAAVSLSRNGKESKINGSLIVDASGFNSGIAAKLGCGKPSDFVMGAQTTVTTNGTDEVEVYFDREIAPGFFSWLVPVSGNKALAGLMARHNVKGYLRSLLAWLTEAGKIKSASSDITVRGIPLKPLAGTYGKRFLICGSAAGQVKPLTGGGIYYGLLCADSAAETIHQAMLSNDFSAGRLAGYEKAWRKKLGHEIRRSYQARLVFERLNNRQLSKAFDITARAGLIDAILADPEVSFDWHGDLAGRIMRQKALSGVLALVKSSFRLLKQQAN